MKKFTLWPWVLCTVAAVVGGFREGGGEMVFPDGRRVAQPSFDLLAAVTYFLLAWGALVVVILVWQGMKDHVISEYENGKPKVQSTAPHSE